MDEQRRRKHLVSNFNECQNPLTSAIEFILLLEEEIRRLRNQQKRPQRSVLYRMNMALQAAGLSKEDADTMLFATGDSLEEAASLIERIRAMPEPSRERGLARVVMDAHGGNKPVAAGC